MSEYCDGYMVLEYSVCTLLMVMMDRRGDVKQAKV